MVKNLLQYRRPGSIPGLEDFPGIENATHSSILAWRIPWTEEPGGLQSMGSIFFKKYTLDPEMPLPVYPKGMINDTSKYLPSRMSNSTIFL